MERPLSLHERLEVKLHLWICAWCQWYLEHLQLIRATARAKGNEALEPVTDAATIAAWSAELTGIHIASELQGYIVDVIDATRHHRDILCAKLSHDQLAGVAHGR